MKTNKKFSVTKQNLWVDLLIAGGFLLAAQPHLTGMAIHEWLSLGLGVGFLTHILLHWRWVFETTRRLFGKLAGQARVNYVLNLALLVAFTLIIFSGLMISEEVLPLLGLQGVHGGVWKSLHTLAAEAVVWLVGLHIALHWKWIVTNSKKYLFGWLPKRRQAAVKPSEAAV
ncbi:MAG: DUF4405 domain-containing protein [Candidatus Promineifilaceae bacterium]|nr:DUF4405 domain-containing protein [Anaerolineaceae bacterium]